jgi:ribosomal protein S18 acetylase RimI-like enzyme
VSIQLHPATPADIDDLVALNGLVQDLHADLSPQIFRRDWDPVELAAFWRAKLAEDNGRVLIARTGAEVVGYIWMELQSRDADPLRHERRRVYVHHICVRPEWRGRGVGTRLLSAADGFARETGASSVLLDVWHENIVGRKAFERTGFTPLNLLMSRSLGMAGSSG